MTSVLTADQRATLNSEKFMKAVALRLKSPKDYLDKEEIIVVPLNDLVYAADIYYNHFNKGRREAYSTHFNAKAFAAVLPLSETNHNHEVFHLNPNDHAANARELFQKVSKTKSIVLAHKGQSFALMITYAALEKELAIVPR